MKWKLKIDWRKVVLFLVISAGLLYLTRSVLMAAGVIMLLFVVDSLISDYEYRRKNHELFKDIREQQEQKTKEKQSDADRRH
jgi:TRAP-type C4-dicarboxylate transport system permease small subunit